MSEHLRPGHEIEPNNAEHHKGAEKHVESHEKEHTLAKHRKEIEKNVEAHALSNSEIEAKSAEKSHDQPHSHHITKDIKKVTFQRSMVRVRKRLSTPNKVLSSVVHQPAVERVSEAAGRTIARPSGVLGGGLFAFIGTLLLLYVTRKYGYEFNYLVFFMLFVGGFMIGAILELLLFSVKSSKASD
ncbi:MAG: hypothetical protein M3Q70_00040 [bacterium]|nr:hypothetical protein [bacterium]